MRRKLGIAEKFESRKLSESNSSSSSSLKETPLTPFIRCDQVQPSLRDCQHISDYVIDSTKQYYVDNSAKMQSQIFLIERLSKEVKVLKAKLTGGVYQPDQKKKKNLFCSSFEMEAIAKRSKS